MHGARGNKKRENEEKRRKDANKKRRKIKKVKKESSLKGVNSRSHLQVFQIPIELLKNSIQSNHIALEVVSVRMEEVKFFFVNNRESRRRKKAKKLKSNHI